MGAFPMEFCMRRLHTWSVRAGALATLALAVAAAQPAHAQLFGTAPPTNSEQLLIDPPAPNTPPRRIALVSGVGSVMHYVEAKQEVGSRIDPFVRRQVEIPSQGLNTMVLRGLDSAIAQIDPSAERILLQIAPPSLEGVSHNQRHEVVANDMRTKLTGFAEREKWDLIVAVSPRYQHSGFNRMGDKLWGLGVYVYGLESAQIGDAGGELPSDFETFTSPDEDVATPDKGRARANKFVAPYAFLRFTVYNAKTMEVVRVLDRLDARKTADPNCTAVNVAKCFSTAQYVEMIANQAERTAVAGVRGGRTGTVEMKDARVVPQAPPARGQ
jgi:hypothetical protein